MLLQTSPPITAERQSKGINCVLCLLIAHTNTIERRYIIMDNDSGALILLIVLVVSAFLLIVLKLAQFVNHFSREKQYLLTEMHRAADYNEYCYWRRELRCLYLCLIPFVTERNVMKVYLSLIHI